MRAFRFGYQVRADTAEVFRREVQEAEAAGFDVVCTFDHLGAGYSIVDWPAQFVDTEFTKRLRDLGGRAERAALLAWLLGRGPAPELGPW